MIVHLLISLVGYLVSGLILLGIVAFFFTQVAGRAVGRFFILVGLWFAGEWFAKYCLVDSVGLLSSENALFRVTGLVTAGITAVCIAVLDLLQARWKSRQDGRRCMERYVWGMGAAILFGAFSHLVFGGTLLPLSDLTRYRLEERLGGRAGKVGEKG